MKSTDGICEWWGRFLLWLIIDNQSVSLAEETNFINLWKRARHSVARLHLIFEKGEILTSRRSKGKLYSQQNQENKNNELYTVPLLHHIYVKYITYISFYRIPPSSIFWCLPINISYIMHNDNTW